MAASTGRRQGARKPRIPPIEAALDPELAAKHAQLRHVDDTGPPSLIETDETNHLNRTRTGRLVTMWLAARFRHGAFQGVLAAGLIALLITAYGIGQLKAQS